MPRKRSRRSFGSITEVVKGKKYICRWMENTDAGRSRRSKTLDGTYSEATMFLARKQVELGEQKRVPTVGEVFDVWYVPWTERQIEDGKKKRSTADRYIEVYRNVIKPRWASTPMDRVNPVQLQSWLLSQNKSNASIAMVVLRKMGDLATMYEAVDHNVFQRDFDLPRAKSRAKKREVYSLSQAADVLESLKGTLVYAPYILSCFGGARVGESLGVMCPEVSEMTVGGVRFAAVPIRRRMPKTGCDPLPDGDLKTPQSLRETLIPEPYCDELLDEVARRASQGSIWLADRGDGLPLNENSYMYYFKQSAGDRAIPLSNLRASWRTFAQFDWHVPSDTLELLMGHTLKGVSGKHYIRPSIMDMAKSFAEAYREAKDI